MLFKPRHCPNCGIKWADGAKPGTCDLCGFDLTLGSQPGIQPGQKIPTARYARQTPPETKPVRSGYRPILPGIEILDPDNLLASVDPAVINGMRNRMTSILGRQAEKGGTGRLSEQRMAKVAVVLQALHNAVPGGNVELILESEDLELPLRIIAAPAGQWQGNSPGRPLSETMPAGKQGPLAKVLKVIVYLGIGLFLFLKYYFEQR